MLSTIKTLFSTLKEAQVQYCIYKGFERLERDFSTAEHDIDIMVSKADKSRLDKILKQSQFKRVLFPVPVHHQLYIGYDLRSARRIIIDVVSVVRFGPKPARPWICPLAEALLARRVWDEQFQCYRLRDNDIPWMLCLQLIANPNSTSADAKIQFLSEYWSAGAKESPLGQWLANQLQLSLSDLSKKIQLPSKDNVWQTFQYKMANAMTNTIRKKVQIGWRRLNHFALQVRSKISRQIGGPPMRVRKRGALFVMVGIDGSGKSTQVNFFLQHPYFQMTGIKRLYLGSGEFWLPGFNRLMNYFLKQKQPNKILKAIVVLLKFVDRRLRLFTVMYYRLRGNHVLCDRYFYDDLIFIRSKAYQQRSTFVRGIAKIMYGWLGIRPAKTFFLNISPENAYQRKQDYDLATVAHMIEQYRDILPQRKEVMTIDATLPIEEVTRQIAFVMSAT